MPRQNEFGPCLLTGIGCWQNDGCAEIAGGAQAGKASSGWFFDNLVVVIGILIWVLRGGGLALRGRSVAAHHTSSLN